MWQILQISREEICRFSGDVQGSNQIPRVNEDLAQILGCIDYSTFNNFIAL